MSLNGGVQYIIAYLDGEADQKVDVALLQEILTGIAGEGTTVNLYQDYDNYFAVTAPNMTY